MKITSVFAISAARLYYAFPTTASSAVKPPSEFSFVWMHTNSISLSCAAKNCLFAAGEMRTQSPAISSTVSPSITTLPFPDSMP